MRLVRPLVLHRLVLRHGMAHHPVHQPHQRQHRPEQRAPVEGGQQRPGQDRRQAGAQHDAEGQEQQRRQARRPLVMQDLHPRRGEERRPAQRLHHARGDESAGVGRQRAQHGAGAEHPQRQPQQGTVAQPLHPPAVAQDHQHRHRRVTGGGQAELLRRGLHAVADGGRAERHHHALQVFQQHDHGDGDVVQRVTRGDEGGRRHGGTSNGEAKPHYRQQPYYHGNRLTAYRS